MLFVQSKSVSLESISFVSTSAAGNGVIYIEMLVYIDHFSVTEFNCCRCYNFKLQACNIEYIRKDF